ncbi:MAG TPA: hypothetical protein PKO09_06865 [Anaerolineae bacterium]|nr:hypothetical protein [Anaerolineae bacterium]
MQSTIPAALQAALWPLAGATLVVALSRLLPQWLGRFLALAASVASLVALFLSLGQATAGFRATWEPFTFLRTAPALRPTPLGTAVGIILAAWCTTAAVGIRGPQPSRSTWRGLALVLLAGALVIALAANLVTLMLGSALLDLGLALLAVSASGGRQGQLTWLRMLAPGLVSTGLLTLAALRMDSSIGTQALSMEGFAPEVLSFLVAAGLLRAAVFPLHPRRLQSPEHAAALLLPLGAGVLLVARAQTLGGTPEGTPWFLAISALALAAGSWQAWSTGGVPPQPGTWAETWTALAVQQVGAAFLFLLLFPGAAPWPLAGLVPALGIMAIWWDAEQSSGPSSVAPWIEWIRRQWTQGRELLRSRAAELLGRRAQPAPGDGAGLQPPAIRQAQQSRTREGWERLKASWLARRGAVLLPGVALASLAGVPMTAGSVSRWHSYGALLASAQPLPLAGYLVSDALLAAGLILAWRKLVCKAGGRRPGWVALGMMGLLSAASIALWLVPSLWGRLGLPALQPVEISPWGVGILYVLPWLLGAWLAKAVGSVEGFLLHLRRGVSVEGALRPAEWLAEKVLAVVYWVGSVGEGEGWWGWALVVLALGALYLAAR